MSIKSISVIVLVTIVSSNTVRCTLTSDVLPDTAKPATLPVSGTHTTLNDELLDALKNFHSSLPAAGQKTPATETTPIPPPLANDRISIMHFPAAPALGSANGAAPNLMVPGVIHQRPFSSLNSNHFPVSVESPPIAETGPSSAPAAVAPDHRSPPASSRSPDPALLKIEPVSLPQGANQELMKLLSDLRTTPAASLKQLPVAPSQSQMLANGPAETPPILSPGSSPSLQPPNVARPILGPNQTPLDYLLSPSFPVHHLNSIAGYSTPSANANTSPTVDRKQPSTAKPRPNLEFVKYLLTLPRYQQALNDLVKAQSLIQT